MTLRYEFIPNGFARDKFNLAAQSYYGAGLTPLLEEALGKDNYNKYVPAQDTFSGDKTKADIDIIVNPEETNPAKMIFRSIGYVHELAQEPEIPNKLPAASLDPEVRAAIRILSTTKPA